MHAAPAHEAHEAHETARGIASRAVVRSGPHEVPREAGPLPESETPQTLTVASSVASIVTSALSSREMGQPALAPFATSRNFA